MVCISTVLICASEFKAKNQLEKVIILWSANTERFCDIVEGKNDTAENLLRAIEYVLFQ